MVMVPFNTLVFPILQAAVTQNSGVGLPDTQFYFTPAQFFERIQGYGENGRQTYLIMLATADIIYPLLFSIFLSFSINLALKQSFSLANPIRRTQLFPLGMLLFSYLENLSLALLINLYPSQTVWLAWTASVNNTLKWCFTFFSAIALIIGIGKLLFTFTQPKLPNGE